VTPAQLHEALTPEDGRYLECGEPSPETTRTVAVLDKRTRERDEVRDALALEDIEDWRNGALAPAPRTRRTFRKTGSPTAPSPQVPARCVAPTSGGSPGAVGYGSSAGSAIPICRSRPLR
jgi:hypothetical protein